MTSSSKDISASPWSNDSDKYKEVHTEVLKSESSSSSHHSLMPPFEITTDNRSVANESLATATTTAASSNHEQRRISHEARGTRLRNRTAHFVADHAPRIPYDDMSCSGESTMSVQSTRSTDTTSSIVTALLGSARIADIINNSSSSSSTATNNGKTSSHETTEIMVVSSLRLAGLVRVLNSSERCDGIPKEYSKGNSLARRLKEIFTFPLDKTPNWFWRPLFEGLMKGGAELDTAVTPPTGAQPMPLLTWLCQWRSMQKLFYWKGGTDMVSIALAAGANPNVELRNGSTPLFFAVKYGCLDTVKLLVKYGADVTIKDKNGRSCLWNALERPMPEVIFYLLTKGGLSADEAFPYRRHQARREKSYQTAIDYLFAAQLSLSFDEASNPEFPWSWKVLGVPSEESVALAMIHFGKQGATFSPNDITLQLISFVLRGDDPNRRLNRYPKYEEAKLRLQHLAHLMVGRWLPEPVKKRMMEESPMDKDSVGITDSVLVCSICQEDINATGHQHTKLYCGHNYCLDCIMSHSHNEVTSILDLTCPVCKKALCLELAGSLSRRWECLTELYGDWDGGCHGPSVLSKQQLRTECQVRGITTILRNDVTLKKLLYNDTVESGSNTATLSMQEEKSSKQRFDLNTNVPITDQLSEDPTSVLLAPKGGPVAIPIVVKGIPVTAYISTTSYYTLVAPEFVELFALGGDRKSDSHLGVSDTFQNSLGRPTLQIDNGAGASLRRLENNFKFQLGGTIDICLPSALEAPLPSCMGVQLGMDFLRSGAWCVIDVKLEGEVGQLERSGSFVSTDGFGHVSYIKGRTRRVEELRYYARDGMILRTPLLHLQPFQKGCMMTNWVSVAYDNSFVECNWCCRVFPPEGMILQGDISTLSPPLAGKAQQHEVSCYYCSETCCASAKDVRKARHDHSLDIF